MFSLSAEPIDVRELRDGMMLADCGGFSVFEGWVRNLNEGKIVQKLTYEAYGDLAILEAERIEKEACELFPFRQIRSVHRVGTLEVGEVAVWIGVAAVHRKESFGACRYVIDEIKKRVPIWKKEYFADGTESWTRCDHCAGNFAHDH